MIQKFWVTVVLAVTLISPVLSAEEAPWDFAGPNVPPATLTKPATLAGDLFKVLVNAYRDNGLKNSVPRCIFDVTCSHFAERAFSKYGGLVGTIVFIDRYFYRENDAARYLYPRAGEEDGTFRLDDGPFVP